MISSIRYFPHVFLLMLLYTGKMENLVTRVVSFSNKYEDEELNSKKDRNINAIMRRSIYSYTLYNLVQNSTLVILAEGPTISIIVMLSIVVIERWLLLSPIQSVQLTYDLNLISGSPRPSEIGTPTLN